MRRRGGGPLIQAQGCHNEQRRCGTIVRVQYLYSMYVWSWTATSKKSVIILHPHRNPISLSAPVGAIFHPRTRM